MDFDPLDIWISLNFSHLVVASKVLEQEPAVTYLLHAYCHRAGNFFCLLLNFVRWRAISYILLVLCERDVVSFWFLTNMFNSILPLLASKNPWSQILLKTFFYHCLQPVMIKFRFFVMNLQVVHFQHGLDFLRRSYSSFVQTFQDVIKLEIAPLTIKFCPISCRTPEYRHSEEQPKISRHNRVLIHWRQWPGSNRRSSMRFAFREGIGLLSEPFVPPDWPLSWNRNSG